MNIQSEIDRIVGGKTAIATAIEGKGVTVPDGTLLDGMAPLIESIEAGGGGVQPDWNQNDSTQPDYIKNRPFYTGDPVETVLVEESTVSFSLSEGEGVYIGRLKSTFSATVGETYKVSWDGTVYECTSADFSGRAAIGNLSIAGAGSDTGEPFIMVIFNGRNITIGTADTSASHTVSISATVVPVVKIDEKYLPDSIISDISTAQATANTAKSTADAAQSTADAAQSTANTAQSTADAAQSTANAALERTVEPYTRKAQMAPLYTNGGFWAWRGVVQEISYDKTEGYFFVNGFDMTALKEKDMPDGVFCVSVYVGNQRARAFLTKLIHPGGSGSWSVGGFAVIIDNYRTGEVLHVSSNNIPLREAKGLFLTFRAPASMLLKSSTGGSDKQFRITVDDSGTLTATEVS